MTTRPVELNAVDEITALREAYHLSLINPGRYIIVFGCFGLFASIKHQLNVEAPGDSLYDWYVHNGNVKPFTEKQRAKDQAKNWRD